MSLEYMKSMKKMKFLISGLVAVLAVALFAYFYSNGTFAGKSVFEKKIAAYEAAAVKVNAAKEISELNEINKALEDEIDGIEQQCAEELKGVHEKKAGEADAYKSEEEALKAAQKAYDDAFVEMFLNLGVQ